LRIFTAIGDASVRETPAFQELADHHARMIEAYRSQRWDEALEALNASRQHAAAPAGPGSMFAYYELMEKRIRHYQEEPPPADWDGVFVATSKTG
jgi:adenylate cyclase